MSTPARHTVPATIAIYAAVAFALFTRGKIPGQYYNLLLSAFLMLASILWAAGDLSALREDDGNRRWIFTNSLTLREHSRYYFLEVILLVGLMLIFTISSRQYLLIVLCFFCVPVYTHILLGAVSVNSYLNSLGNAPLEGAQRKYSTEERREILKAFTEGRRGGPLLVLLAISFSTVSRLYDTFKTSAVSTMGTGVFFCIFAFVVAVSLVAGFLGTAFNLNLALCGLKRESELSGDCARDDEIFEANRIFARHAKHVAVTLAFVLYPAMFYVLYLLLSSQ